MAELQRMNEEFGLSSQEIEIEGISTEPLYTPSINNNTTDEKNNNIKIDESNEMDIVEVKRVKTGISRTSTRTSFLPPERRKSFQIRAMFRKTLSYQKRQMKTNLCCVAACPTMMILTAFLLSLLVEHFLKDLIKPEKYEYCTNEFNGHFVLPSSEPEFKKDEPDVHICHYVGGGLFSGNSPCSHWFGTNDYFASAPYDIIPDHNDENINRDTLFTPPLDTSGNYRYIMNLLQKVSEMSGGYNLYGNNSELKNFLNNGNGNSNGNGNDNGNDNDNDNNNSNNKKREEFNLDQLSQLREAANLNYIKDNMIRPWGFVAFNKGNSTEKALIGERNEGPSNITMNELNFDNHNLTNHGYLDYTFTRYFMDLSELFNVNGEASITFERLPYFKLIEVENGDGVDKFLTQRMELIDKIISNSSFDSYTEEEKKQIDLSVFKDSDEAIEKSVDLMPYGVIYYKDINEQKLDYTVEISVGDYSRLRSLSSCEVCTTKPYMSFPGRGKRLMYFLTEFTNSVLRKITNNTSSITQGFRSFPEKYSSELPIDLAGLIGFILFPWGVSFLIPIFVIGLVKEKEERFLVMMNMNGMNTYIYYIFVYITNLILSLISMFFFIITGMICGMYLFTRTSIVVLIIIFFIWSNIQVVVSFVLSFFFKRNGTALIASFLIVLLSIVFGLSLFDIFKTSYAYFIWPLFGFYYILTELSNEAVSKTNPAYQLHNFIPGNRIFNTTMILIVDFIILSFIALYLNSIIPQEYGNHQPWHLNIFKRIKHLFQKIKNKDNNNSDNDNNESGREITNKNEFYPFYSKEEAEEAAILEDDDVKEERNRVLSGNYDRNCPLVIKNVRKEYPPREKRGKPHVAVHSVTFAVEEGIVFGLLGPNGAGKTTLIHSLIGVYTPTSGYAKLAGFNIKTHMDQVYKRIGICPQHDILWDDLTVLEHLLFYARLKGIPKEQEEEAVRESMASVGLESFRDNLVHGLSGGEKRRLSIAIALVGDPKLVFLDEPTTGLDPDVRRLIWSILNEISQNRTIILTTHSMEEAEVLCHRIGIMSHGTLRCCATPLRLKELYGSGFKLSYTNQPEYYQELKEFITSVIPKQHKVVRDLISTSIYEFIPPQGLITKLFRLLEENKKKYGIIDWGISQSSLEEVFLSIISDDDADAS